MSSQQPGFRGEEVEEGTTPACIHPSILLQESIKKKKKLDIHVYEGFSPECLTLLVGGGSLLRFTCMLCFLRASRDSMKPGDNKSTNVY